MAIRPALIIPIALVAMIASPMKAERGPSTPEERARVVSLARASDKDPLGVMNSADAKWFLQWMEDVPDYEFGPDKGAFWALSAAKGDLRKAVRFHITVSTAAYQVQHQILDPRKKPEDDEAVALAGVEGLLRAYETLLPRRPENRSEPLDAALASRNKGELTAFVKALPPMPKR